MIARAYYCSDLDEAIIKATRLIQLDAFKAGAMWAMEIVQHHECPMQKDPINSPSAKAIITATNKLKKLPK